jgi:hypothetical protein
MAQCGIDRSAGRLYQSARTASFGRSARRADQRRLKTSTVMRWRMVSLLSHPRARRVLTTRIAAPHRLGLLRVRIPLQVGELVAAAVVRENLQWAVQERALHGAQQRGQQLLDLPPRQLLVDNDAEHLVIPHERVQERAVFGVGRDDPIGKDRTLWGVAAGHL